ncbi:hypothetical protein KKA14_14260, partial [bacterium]|nr:hypothetical protein [bacterium]
GKAFKKLSIGIKLKEGSPDIDSFDIGGEGYNFSLGATKKAVAKAKKEFETNLKTAKEEAVKQTQKAQKEVEAKLKKEMDRLKKDAEEKLKKQLKGLGI